MKGLKELFKPILKWLNNVPSIPLISSVLSYFSWRLLETNQANKILANIMLIFAIFALGFYLLEKILGIHTPLIKVGKPFKPFRQTSTLENPDSIKQSIEMTVEEGKKLYKNTKGIGERLMKLLKLVYANKFTLLGYLAACLYFMSDVFNLADRWNLSSEWYFTAIAIVYILVSVAIFGRGIESIERFEEIVNKAKALRENAKIQKKIEEARKLKEFLNLADNTPTPTSEQRALTKEEIQEMFKRGQ